MNIFSMVFDAIEGIMTEILGKFNLIPETITAPLNNWVQQVTGGIWKGAGADRFVAEMTGEVIPTLAGLLVGGQGFVGGIKKSQDHMSAGFAQATKIAGGLVDVFNDIF